jgi:hypothetical protein
MSTARKSGVQLFTTRWVHVFEEDTPQGAVYRPVEGDIAASRRPREQLELAPDGSAMLFVGGADDRLEGQRATWRDDAGEAATRDDASLRIRLIDQSPERIVVRVESARPAR